MSKETASSELTLWYTKASVATHLTVHPEIINSYTRIVSQQCWVPRCCNAWSPDNRGGPTSSSGAWVWAYATETISTDMLCDSNVVNVKTITDNNY